MYEIAHTHTHKNHQKTGTGRIVSRTILTWLVPGALGERKLGEQQNSTRTNSTRGQGGAVETLLLSRPK